MDDVVANSRAPNTPDYTIPDDFRLDAYVGRQAWELGEGDTPPVMARVLFNFPLSLWAQRNQHGALETQRTDGGSVRRFDVHQVEPFLRWILSLEGEAQLLEPEELTFALRRMAVRVAHAHKSDA
jgi:hypothetical protein